MKRYRHASRDAQGALVRGEVEAVDRRDAARLLSSTGLFPIELALWSRAPWNRIRATRQDLALLLEDLSDLLAAGVPVARALEVLGRSRGLRACKPMLARITDRISRGASLAAAFAAEGAPVPTTLAPVLAAAELGGGLATAARDYSALMKSQEHVRKRFQRALSYPLVVSLAAGATLVLVLTYLVPRLETLYGDLGQALPWPTRFLMGLSLAARTHLGWAAVICAPVLGAILIQYRRSESLRLWIHGRLLRIPGIGTLIRARELSTFCRGMATLLSGGVPFQTALGQIAGSTVNPVFGRELQGLSEAVLRGSTISSAVAAAPLLAGSLESLLTVGEEAGDMPRAFIKAAAFYERRLEARVEQIATVLEPALILALGVFVALLVLAMILPILEIDFMI